MALHNMHNFRASSSVQDAVIDKFGIPVVIFKPKATLKMIGYEHVDPTQWDKFTGVKAYIDFNPKRRVFYHYNWFPEGDTQVQSIAFPISFPIVADMLVRTSPMPGVTESSMPSGDLLFRIVKVVEEGKYKVLKRLCFAVLVPDRTLYEKFVP